MKIISYKVESSNDDQICFPELSFKKLNLIVGNSGTGKTRLLNTIFNIANMAVNKNKFYLGSWSIVFEHESIKYTWVIETEKDTDENRWIKKEEITSHINHLESKTIISRDTKKFIYNDKDMPKLSKTESSISLLREEDLIEPIFEAFSSVMRRNFSGPDLESETGYQNISDSFESKLKKSQDLKDLFTSGFNLNCKLYFLNKFFKNIYEDICNQFIETFPFVKKCKMMNADSFGIHYVGKIPVFVLKEHEIDNWVPLPKFSSGMKKVLLMLTDIKILPSTGCVYLIDEYENSLGINAINFFPTMLIEADSQSQFIITSHHPYIIGNVPVKNWIVFNRKGNTIAVKQGDELEDRYSKSKQQAFIQLINDPFFVENIE
jgi:predicted ATPase